MKRKRTLMQRESDLVFISDLYARGKTHQEIRDELAEVRDYEVCRSQITKDIQEIRKRWQAIAMQDYEKKIATELAKIDHLEREAWDAWDRSRGVDITEYEKTSEADGGNAKEKSVKKRYPHGDPRYLEQVQKCIGQRITLLGLAAPDMHLIAGGSAEIEGNEVVFTLDLGERRVNDSD